MSNWLYIIGNGFDRAHLMETGYDDFGAFLKQRDLNTYRRLEQYFSVDDDFWSTFEAQLANFDTERLIDDASVFLAGYGDDDWSESGHHDYQYELRQATRAISSTLRQRFGEWVRLIALPSEEEFAKTRLRLDPAARYLNFNYTPTLQSMYGIPDSQVLHIHGAASDPDVELILGHGWEPEHNPDPYRFESDPESADMRVVEGQGIIDNYFKDTFKPTADVLTRHDGFFSALHAVEQIVVLGHSLSEVDAPYFERILEALGTKPVNWAVSYFDKLHEVQERASNLGLVAERVQFFRIEALRFTSSIGH